MAHGVYLQYALGAHGGYVHAGSQNSCLKMLVDQYPYAVCSTGCYSGAHGLADCSHARASPAMLPAGPDMLQDLLATAPAVRRLFR